MKFDLPYDLQMPKAHDERSEWRCLHEALEQIEQAAGRDHFIALMQTDRIPHAAVTRSIELFAEHVMSRFR